MSQRKPNPGGSESLRGRKLYFPVESFSPRWGDLIEAALDRAQELEFPTERAAKLFQLRFHNYRATVRKHGPASQAARYVYSVRTALRGNKLIVYKADTEFDTILKAFEPEARTVQPLDRTAAQTSVPKTNLDSAKPKLPVVEDAIIDRDELFDGLEDDAE